MMVDTLNLRPGKKLWTLETKKPLSYDERRVGKSSTSSRVSFLCTTGAAWERTYERESINNGEEEGGHGGGGDGRRRDHRLLAYGPLRPPLPRRPPRPAQVATAFFAVVSAH